MEFIQANKSTRKLFITNPNSLCDRIMACLAGIELAKKTNRSLLFWWRKTAACNCSSSTVLSTNKLNIIDGNDPMPEFPWKTNVKDLEEYVAGPEPIIKISGFAEQSTIGFDKTFYPSASVRKAVALLVEPFLLFPPPPEPGSENTIGVNSEDISFLHESDINTKILAISKANIDRPNVIKFTPVTVHDEAVALWAIRTMGYLICDNSNFSKLACEGKNSSSALQRD